MTDARAANRQADDIQRLIALDVRSWTGYREEVWTLVEQQRAAGVRTAVLSNGVPEIMEVIERERAISTRSSTRWSSQARSAARSLMPRSSS